MFSLCDSKYESILLADSRLPKRCSAKFKCMAALAIANGHARTRASSQSLHLRIIRLDLKLREPKLTTSTILLLITRRFKAIMDSIDVKFLNTEGSTLSDSDLELIKKTSELKHWPKTPFPINHEINKRVFLYNGDLERLRADAIVNPTDENLNQLGLVIKLAGQDLENYVRKKIRVCATGDIRISPGFKSNFKHIIHAVPPKYQPKYKTAAETALFHTYFRILENMIDKKIRTVVMPTLATPKCNLPIEENYHLQLRVIRRILEKKGREFDKIVVHLENVDQFKIPFYCYFPHTLLDEEIACHYFNGPVGGPNGEPVIPEREIRIKSKPAILDPNDRSIDLTSGLDLSTVVGKTPFSKMRDDLDKQRSALKTSIMTNCQPNHCKTIAIRKKNVFRGCSLL